jgi:hypothetical protein
LLAKVARWRSPPARRGVVERDNELCLTDDGFAEREPELAALATAAVTGNPPAGPEHRQHPAIALPDRGEARLDGDLEVNLVGGHLQMASRNPCASTEPTAVSCSKCIPTLPAWLSGQLARNAHEVP